MQIAYKIQGVRFNMAVKDIIQALQQFDPNSELVCQVVGAKAGAWNMGLALQKVETSNLVVLTLHHPDLVYLPTDCSEPVQAFQCEKGHKFLALPDHPVILGRQICPHCAAKGGITIP